MRIIETLRDEMAIQGVKLEAADSELRQGLEKEVLMREEAVAGTTRAWQKANSKTNEDWRAAVREDGIMREEATLRLNQLIVEVRTRIEEVRSYHEQHQEEVRQQFKATTEALMLEEEARKKEDFVLKKDFDQHSGNFHADRGERSMADQQATNRFVLLESQLREEAMLRADTERAFQKD